mmetsp:Transcript_107643/g.343560  ORF Transcript_107643/g.343560 Transcript_107643/m.343560 type:complete len:217 (+) Transcript_107643:536-1186(+)
MLFVCNSSWSMCLPIPSSILCTPPASTKAWRPVVREPTKADMASTPVSATAASALKRCNSCTAARSAPASTRAGASSVHVSAFAHVLAKASQPCAASALATVVCETKRSAMKRSSMTSFCTNRETRRSTAVCQDASPRSALSKTLAKFEHCEVGVVRGLPWSSTSAATMRANASPAFTHASPGFALLLGSGTREAAARRADKASWLANFWTATALS